MGGSLAASDDTRRPRTVPCQTDIQNVSQLINPLTGGLDASLIASLFDLEDANTTLSIDVCDDKEDWPAWPFDPKGAFAVKASYRVGITIKDKKRGKDAACS
jgi:hypothetical protein